MSVFHLVVGNYEPINDPLGMELQGVIGVNTSRMTSNSNSMALAVAVNTSIEQNLRIDHGRKTLFFYWKSLQVAMGAYEKLKDLS